MVRAGQILEHMIMAVFYFIKVIELEEKVDKLKEKKDKLQAGILSVIEALFNEDYKSLVILRYLQDLEWGIVCAKLSIAETSAMHWHREG